MKKTLDIRVGVLEATVEGLNGLPGQLKELSSQFVQLREEVRSENSSTRGEVSTTRGELRVEMGAMRDELRGDMSDMHKDLAKAILSSEERVVGQVRLLHEDVIARIELIREPLRPATGPRRSGPSGGRRRR